MSRERDTDTLTRIDLGPDQPTVKNFAGDEAETHRLDPRHYAPLRVCPECSLAWEITGEWCPSCGTAFDKSARESVRATRVMPARPVSPARVGSQPPLSRSARKRGVKPPPPAPKAAAPAKSGSAGKYFLIAVAFVAAVAIAFLAGQATRLSADQVDQRTAEAAQTARQSAANSYSRAFEKLQAQYEKARQAAVERARAEGLADAQVQQQASEQAGSSVIDKIGRCIVDLQC
jgi:hypothetical protein